MAGFSAFPALIAMAAGLLVIAVTGLLLVKRRRRAMREAEAENVPAAVHRENIPLPAEDADFLQARLDPVRLTLGNDRIVLQFRLTLANTGPGHLVGLRTRLDLTSASSGQEESAAVQQGPDKARADEAVVHSIAPGKEAEVEGSVSLGLEDIHAIAQDDVQLLLPLARLRVVGAGTPVRRFAFVIGHPSAKSGGLLRPIRTDEGPRVVTELAARVIG